MSRREFFRMTQGTVRVPGFYVPEHLLGWMNGVLTVPRQFTGHLHQA